LSLWGWLLWLSLRGWLLLCGLLLLLLLFFNSFIKKSLPFLMTVVVMISCFLLMEKYISTCKHFVSSRIKQFVCFKFRTVPNENTFSGFSIQFPPILLWNMCKSFTPKYFQIINCRFGTIQGFEWSDTIKTPCSTSILFLNCSIYGFSPKCI
jgi:hypothetical protein